MVAHIERPPFSKSLDSHLLWDKNFLKFLKLILNLENYILLILHRTLKTVVLLSDKIIIFRLIKEMLFVLQMIT